MSLRLRTRRWWLWSSLALSVPASAHQEAPGEQARVLQVLEGERGSEPQTYEQFVVHAINTGEDVTIDMVAGEATEASRQSLTHQFRCLRTEREAEIDTHVISLLFQLARHVHAPIELVSGYRAPTHARDHNYHARGQAADVRVKGLPTRTFFQLARSLHIPGLGLYPASGMIHIDVRDVPYRWVDYTGKRLP